MKCNGLTPFKNVFAYLKKILCQLKCNATACLFENEMYLINGFG